MMSFSSKLNKMADENDTLVTELEEVKSGVTELVEKFPIGDHEPYIYELLKVAKSPQSRIDEVKKKRATSVGRKSVGSKK